MDPTNEENLKKLLSEVEGIRVRLKTISDASYGDMEGADAPDFFISEALWCGLESAAECIANTIEAVNEINKR